MDHNSFVTRRRYAPAYSNSALSVATNSYADGMFVSPYGATEVANPQRELEKTSSRTDAGFVETRLQDWQMYRAPTYTHPHVVEETGTAELDLDNKRVVSASTQTDMTGAQSGASTDVYGNPPGETPLGDTHHEKGRGVFDESPGAQSVAGGGAGVKPDNSMSHNPNDARGLEPNLLGVFDRAQGDQSKTSHSEQAGTIPVNPVSDETDDNEFKLAVGTTPEDKVKILREKIQEVDAQSAELRYEIAQIVAKTNNKNINTKQKNAISELQKKLDELKDKKKKFVTQRNRMAEMA